MLVILWEKKEPHSQLVGTETGAGTLEISMENSEKKN